MNRLIIQDNMVIAPKKIRQTQPLALILTFFTGFSGLVYEVTWHRYLSNLLGSQSQAAAMILAVFLGGLCAGYLVFGRYSRARSPRQLVAATGWIEIGIGVWAILFPRIYKLVWQEIGLLQPASAFSLFIDLSICIGLIAAPTVLMGGTLPLLTQGLSRNLADSSTFHAKVYATNTAGAFAGCLCAGFIMIPGFGLPLTMLMSSPINLVAGIILVILARKCEASAQFSDSRADVHKDALNETTHLTLARGSLVAFLAGFSSLTLQTLLMRLVGLTMGSSEYAFCIVVSVFIFMLALGASECGRKEGSRITLLRNQIFVVLGTLLIYVSVPYWPYSAHVVRTLLASEKPNFYVFHLLMLLGIGLLLYLPVGAMGRTMPLLFANVRDNFGSLGSCVGRLYGWNTFGCVSGALLGGFLCLYYFNFDQILKLLLLIMTGTVVIVTPWHTLRRAHFAKTKAALSTIVLALCVMALQEWPKERLAVGTFRRKKADSLTFLGAQRFYEKFTANLKLLAYRDDPNTTVSITEVPTESGSRTELPVRSVWVNGKSDGSTRGSDLRTTRLLAHLPALFSNAQSAKAAVVGFGTGITIGSLTLYPELSEVHALEISPSVREFSRYFDYRNHGASRHPKVRWFVNDAYRVLGGSNDAFSVIVSEPSNPWVAGVERLYTEEFYEIVKAKLAPGGVFAQWFHTYAISLNTFRLVINTFSRSFKNFRIFRTGGDVILIGTQETLGTEVIDQAAERFLRDPVRDEFHELGINSLEELLSLEVAFPKELAKDAGYHSLDFPQLSFSAGKDFFLGEPVGLDDFFERTENRPAEAVQSRLTLLAQRISAKSVSMATLEDIARNVCEIQRLKIPSGAEVESRLCRALVAYLAAYGKIETDSKALSAELDLFRTLLEIKGSTPEELRGAPQAKDSAQAFLAISVFDKYVTPLTDISAAALRHFVSPCLKVTSRHALECTKKLSEALAALGYAEDAAKEREKLEVLLKEN